MKEKVIKQEEGEVGEVGTRVNASGLGSTVGSSRGLTLNLGNYESARFDVWASVPCDGTSEGMESAYGVCKEFIEGKLSELVTEVRKG